jgi:5'-AMP-activated protein kinase, regulatory beta subunit
MLERCFVLFFFFSDPAESVYVCGDWDNYQSRKPLVKSDSAHTLILELSPGQHRYCFEVDGKRVTDADKPTTSTHTGETFNVLVAEHVGEFAVSSHTTRSSSPPGEYGQEITEPPPNPRAKRKGNPNEPPMLPPHLLRALLNTQPSSSNPLLLPLPHHVMLNHLYINTSREKDGILIHGVTCRYKSKVREKRRLR